MTTKYVFMFFLCFSPIIFCGEYEQKGGAAHEQEKKAASNPRAEIRFESEEQAMRAAYDAADNYMDNRGGTPDDYNREYDRVMNLYFEQVGREKQGKLPSN